MNNKPTILIAYIPSKFNDYNEKIKKEMPTLFHDVINENTLSLITEQNRDYFREATDIAYVRGTMSNYEVIEFFFKEVNEDEIIDFNILLNKAEKAIIKTCYFQQDVLLYIISSVNKKFRNVTGISYPSYLDIKSGNTTLHIFEQFNNFKGMERLDIFYNDEYDNKNYCIPKIYLSDKYLHMDELERIHIRQLKDKNIKFKYAHLKLDYFDDLKKIDDVHNKLKEINPEFEGLILNIDGTNIGDITYKDIKVKFITFEFTEHLLRNLRLSKHNDHIDRLFFLEINLNNEYVVDNVLNFINRNRTSVVYIKILPLPYGEKLSEKQQKIFDELSKISINGIYNYIDYEPNL